jgi:hypothetical protein
MRLSTGGLETVKNRSAVEVRDTQKGGRVLPRRGCSGALPEGSCLGRFAGGYGQAKSILLEFIQCGQRKQMLSLFSGRHIGATADSWTADWHPAIPRSASHLGRQRPILPQTSVFGHVWRPHGRRVGARSLGASAWESVPVVDLVADSA